MVRPYRGSVVRFKCRRGYHLFGPRLFHCVDHKEWSHLEAPVCVSKYQRHQSSLPKLFYYALPHIKGDGFVFQNHYCKNVLLLDFGSRMDLFFAPIQRKGNDVHFLRLFFQGPVAMRRKCIKFPTEWPRSMKKERYTNSSARKEPSYLDPLLCTVTDTNGTILLPLV